MIVFQSQLYHGHIPNDLDKDGLDFLGMLLSILDKMTKVYIE